MSAAQLFAELPLVACLAPGVLPVSAPYRVTRPASVAGLHLSFAKPERLLLWAKSAKERGVVLRFDGEAFLIWYWNYQDIALLEANWDALCSLFGVPIPPERPGKVVSKEEAAPCYTAWNATKHLTKKKSTAEGKEETKTQDDIFDRIEETPIPEETPLCFCDVETTGGSPRDGARVVQVALSRLDPLTGEVFEFSSLVNPEGRKSEYGAWLTHKIDWWKSTKAPLFSKLLPKLLPLLSGAVFIAHNGRACDEPYMKNELARIGAEWPCVACIDTLRVAKKLYPWREKRKGGGGFSLGALASSWVLEQGLAHDAKGDVQTLRAIWHHIRTEHPKVTLTQMAGW